MLNWREMQAIDPQILDTWWYFAKRGEGGDGRFHGNCIPQVVANLVVRYTASGDVVWDPMCGSGTTLDVCNELHRVGIGSDIVPIRDDIFVADARTAELWTGRGSPWVAYDGTVLYPYDEEDQYVLHAEPLQAKLLFLHPPYADIVKFNPNEPRDLSNCATVAEFLEEMRAISRNLERSVAKGGYVAILCGDIYKEGQIVPLGYLLMQQWQEMGFRLKNHIVKNMAGNEFNAKSANLWYSRHARFGTGKFTHEDIWVLQRT